MGAAWPVLDHNGDWYAAIGLWTYGKVEVQFERLKTKEPFDDLSMRQAFADRLNAIDGIDIPTDRIDKRPSFPLNHLQEPGAREQFLASLDWCYGAIRDAAP
jgi:hypothetical protein